MPVNDPVLPDYQSRLTARAKSAVFWGVLAFLAGQGVLAYVVSDSHPEIRDPEYGYRLCRLREQMASAPGRPLFLILGSSRTLCGICPTALPPWPKDAGPEPSVFNFSQFATGPLRELLILRRLLAAGYRPESVLLEVWPPFWPQLGYWCDEGQIMLQDLRPEDLSIVRRYFTKSGEAVQKLAFETLLPISGLRSNILARCVASLLPADQDWRHKRMVLWQDGVQPSGWRPWQERGSDEAFRSRIDSIRQQTKPCLDRFAIDAVTDRAWREILEECRRRNIKAALIWMPEHSELRSWYTPEVQGRIDAYLDRLKQEYNVPVFNTRTWVADDGFHDPVHQAPTSAHPFTLRLGRELLQPWLRGKRASYARGSS